MKDNKELQPKVVFDCFAEVNRVPRPSKKEEAMIAFLENFGRSLNLETHTDPTGNVIIRKPATPGNEMRRTVILQSHMDMVCEKNADVDFDFMTDPIRTVTEGEWMKADGTTLGADDGIGVAMQMAVLRSDDIEHGPVECVFTRDEETGLTGAMGMQPGFMSGDNLINLDSEDEGQIYVSCAGGARTTGFFPFCSEAVPAGYYFFKVTVKGLNSTCGPESLHRRSGGRVFRDGEKLGNSAGKCSRHERGDESCRYAENASCPAGDP